MKLHELAPNPGATTGKKRLGRGIGSGLGKTSGKGHKGQKARSGGGKQPGFEGGQMPLARRVPKRGFHNRFAVNYTVVNVERLNSFEDGAVVTPEMMQAAGVIGALENGGVKVLGDGQITRKLTVQANKFTKQAQEKIEAAGGKAEVI